MSEASYSSIESSAGELELKYGHGKEVVLAWRNLKVTVSKKVPQSGYWKKPIVEETVILNNVSGYCKSGVLTAVMGSSGAGKTTLLATVSHRAKLKRDGDLLFNGEPATHEFMSKVSGFVPQHDLVFASLTASEHMEFMSSLMMDKRVRRLNRNRKISCLLSELGLLHCTKTRLSKLSGGEMKRLSLAVQLLTDPAILFCDEPTTGLDSYSAGVVLEHLRACAERGKAVVATIHQPASGHFELFHEVLLLAGGRVAYTGPVEEASSYFNSMGLVCPASYNAAEFYVQQLAVISGKEAECIAKNNWLCDEFVHSARGLTVDEIVMNEVARLRGQQSRGLVKGNWSTHSSTTDSLLSNGNGQSHKMAPVAPIAKPNFFTQLRLLTWRSYLDIRRNSSDIFLRFFLFMMVGALVSTPYIGITNHMNQNTIQNLEGLLHVIITEVVFSCSYNVFHTFPGEIPILLRDLAAGLYTPAPYFFSKLFLILCRAAVEVSIFATFIFLTVQLNGGFVEYLLFLIPVVIAGLTATAYGTVLSAAFESTSTASLLSVPLELVGVMFSGIYLQLLGLPNYISWIKYLSIFYYGQEAISIIQWRQIDHIECYADPNLPCVADGEGALNKYGYHGSNYPTDLLGLVTYYCVANAIAFGALWIRSRKSATY